MATIVSADGEAAFDPRDAHLNDLQAQVAILTNIATALVLRLGGDVALTLNELSGLDHRFSSAHDKATGSVRLTATKRDGASNDLTPEQIRHNAMAAEVALPKAGGIIKPPSGLILP